MKIGFVSDIHEDITSLRAAFTILEQRNCDTVVCLGDIVGFTIPFQRNISQRDATACVEMVADLCTVVVAGNHDLYAVRRCPAFPAGFLYGDAWYGQTFEHRSRRARNRIWLYEDSDLPHRLTARAEEYLRALPEYAVSTLDGLRFLASHFHFPDLSGSTIRVPRRPKHLAEHFRFMAEQGCSLSFSGHGHPEGYARADANALCFEAFSAAPVPPTTRWLVCPCVANTSRKNGVLLYDTALSQLDAIPLGSRKHI